MPVPVEFVSHRRNRIEAPRGGRTTDKARAPDAADLFGKDDTYFLDFPGNPKRPGCVYERDFLARYGDYMPTAYAHITTQEGHEGIALQYWLFYYFNHWNNTHEGDWEMIQLTFEGPTAADALQQEPSRASVTRSTAAASGRTGTIPSSRPKVPARSPSRRQERTRISSSRTSSSGAAKTERGSGATMRRRHRAACRSK